MNRWLANVAFALVVSCMVVALAHAPAFHRLFDGIDEQGVDASMLSRALLQPDTAIAGENDLPAGYVFLDMDAKACRWIENSSLCESRTPASPGVSAQLAAAALDGGAGTVIIDTRLWDIGPGAASYPAAFQVLADAIRRHPAAHVITVAPFRPTGPGKGIVDTSLIPGTLAKSGVRFAPAFTWNSGSVVRRYPRRIVARIDGAERELASVPYLASLYTTSGSAEMVAEADCLAWPAPAGCPAKDHAEQEAAEEGRPLFSLLRQSPDEGAADNALPVSGLWQRYPVSQIVSPRFQLLLAPDALAGKTVIIGTSAAVAMDLHSTPLGEMSGAEIIINMTRSFAAGATIPKPTFWGALLRECVFAVIGSLPYLLFWFIVVKSNTRLKRAGKGEPVTWIVPVTLFVPTVIASASLLISVAMWQVNGRYVSSSTWDLFTPVVSLALASFSDAGKEISQFLERLIERGVHALLNMTRKRIAS